MVFGLLLLFGFCASSLAIGLSPEERTACTRGLICGVNKDQLDFFAIGDTGGIEFNLAQGAISYVQATRMQLRVADTMAKLASKKNLDFVINVGDNVYFNGVDNENDTRFDAVFEKPYSQKRLQVPWTFPAPWYKLNYAFSKYSKRVDFLFLDTIIACGNTIDIDSRSVLSWITAAEKVPKRPDPPYVEQAKKQWAWFEEELKKSRADYLFVVGHYPIYSLSMQRLDCLYDKLDPLLRKYHVTAYIAGHDHSVQYFRDDGDANRVPMRYLVTGAGSRTDAWGSYNGDEDVKLLYRYPKKPDVSLLHARYIQQRNEFGFGYGGFVHFSVGEHRADLSFYAKDLDLEFQESIPARNLDKLPKPTSNKQPVKTRKNRRKRKATKN